jgi:hypothetical protein
MLVRPSLSTIPEQTNAFIPAVRQCLKQCEPNHTSSAPLRASATASYLVLLYGGGSVPAVEDLDGAAPALTVTGTLLAVHWAALATMRPKYC